MRTLSIVERGIIWLEKTAVTLSLVVMFLAAVVQVFLRSAGMRSVGTNEIASIAMAALVFIGAGLAVHTHDHIAVEILSLIKQQTVRRALELLSGSLLLVFGCILTYYSVGYLETVAASGERGLELGIPTTVPVAAVVAGGMLIVLHAATNLVRMLLADGPIPSQGGMEADPRDDSGPRPPTAEG